MELDEMQQKAVDIYTGPALILAGPGSGKTTVMMQRIKRLADKYSVSPDNILAVTFSRAAAGELFSRYCLGNNIYMQTPSFGTFHSIFYRILLTSSPRRYRLIPAADKYGFLLLQLKDNNAAFDDETEAVRSISGYISKVKNNCRVPACPDYYESIRKNYEMYMSECSLLDFDDMILKCFEMLSKDKILLRKWQEKFRFILIDEFQDINELQYRTLLLLAGEDANIFAVGDDDQSIYGFRGAYPGIINTFANEHPGLTMLSLNCNYRSGREILNAASDIICCNTDRVKKSFSRSADPICMKSSVRIFHYASNSTEAAAIAEDISAKYRKGEDLKNTAILFRRNLDMELIIRELKKKHIPICRAGNAAKDTDDTTFQDIMAYISLASGIRSSDTYNDLIRILNKPSRYLSVDSVRCAAAYSGSINRDKPPSVRELLEQMSSYYSCSSAQRQSITDLRKQLSALKGLSSYASVMYIMNVIGYDKYIRGLPQEEQIHAQNVISIIKKAAWNAPRTCELKMAFDTEMKQMGSKEGVRLMTMHASKGLEFDTVYLPSVNETIIPGRHTEPSELNEECRILYVAATRAARELNISYCDSVHGRQDIPSRYINSLLTKSSQQAVYI